MTGKMSQSYRYVLCRAPKFAIQKTTLPIIRCVCGNRILVLPDLKEMDKAIESHLNFHSRICKASRKKAKPINKLREHLIKQLFMAASC